MATAARLSAQKQRATLIILLVGALGGIFPTLLRLAIGLSQNQIEPKDVRISMLLAMVIFAVCGAIVAGIWGEVDLKKVFYLGIGLPSFLTVMTSSASAPPPSVQAQTTGQHVPQLSLSLPPNIVASHPQIIFQMEHGTKSVPYQPTVQVPEGATSFSVHSSRGDSGMIPITSPKVTLRSETDPWYGFKYAFGVNGAKPETLTLGKPQ